VRIYVRGRDVVAHCRVCVSLPCVVWLLLVHDDVYFLVPARALASTATDSVLAALLNTLLLNVNVDGDFFNHVLKENL